MASRCKPKSKLQGGAGVAEKWHVVKYPPPPQNCVLGCRCVGIVLSPLWSEWRGWKTGAWRWGGVETLKQVRTWWGTRKRNGQGCCVASGRWWRGEKASHGGQGVDGETRTLKWKPAWSVDGGRERNKGEGRGGPESGNRRGTRRVKGDKKASRRRGAEKGGRRRRGRCRHENRADALSGSALVAENAFIEAKE